MASRLLTEIDAIANRVKRVATGREPQFTNAVDCIINRTTVMGLCEAFFALNPPTRLRIRAETLSGTLDALTSGRADLALGVAAEGGAITGLQVKPLGMQRFAPHHPLAKAVEPLSDQIIRRHRIVAAAQRSACCWTGCFYSNHHAGKTGSAIAWTGLRLPAGGTCPALYRDRTFGRQTGVSDRRNGAS